MDELGRDFEDLRVGTGDRLAVGQATKEHNRLHQLRSSPTFPIPIPIPILHVAAVVVAISSLQNCQYVPVSSGMHFFTEESNRLAL